MNAITAVVSLRDGHSGKSRLAGVLGAQDRGLLVAALARHVVTTLLDTDLVTQVMVVTADAEFATSSLGPEEPRLRIVEQPADRPGLNAAIDLGRELSSSDPSGRLLVVHADLPALTTGDVVALLASTSAVALAPDRAASGTNALVIEAGLEGFMFRFGPGSFAAHRREASRLGLDPAIVIRDGTSTDLDTVEDWNALTATARGRVARAVPAVLTF